MNLEAFDRISPFVRMTRIQHDSAIAGQWQDIDHVFTLISSGSADFIVNGIRYPLSPGSVIVIPPYQPHVIVSSGSDALEQHILHFDFFEDPERCALGIEDVSRSEAPQRLPSRERLLDDQPFVRALSPESFRTLQALFMQTHAEFRELCAGRGCHALVKAYCTQLLITTLRTGTEAPAVASARDETRSKAWIHIQNALEYIDAHYADERLDNAAISRAIGVSPNYLTKRFNACFGLSMHRYLVRLRLEKAQQLLLSGRSNITEVAAACGFSSIHVFSKTFKAVLGLSPTAYLEQVADDKAAARASREPTLIDRRRMAIL